MKKDIIDYEIKLSVSGFLSLDDVREELRLLADSMSTHKAFADKVGISPQYLHDILAGKRSPGKAVLRFLKLQSVTVYISKRSEDRSVLLRAVREDQHRLNDAGRG